MKKSVEIKVDLGKAVADSLSWIIFYLLAKGYCKARGIDVAANGQNISQLKHFSRIYLYDIDIDNAVKIMENVIS